MTVPAGDPAQITDSKSAAGRAGIFGMVFIWVLAAALIVWDIVRESERGESISIFLWFGVVALVVWALLIVRMWIKSSRAAKRSVNQ